MKYQFDIKLVTEVETPWATPEEAYDFMDEYCEKVLTGCLLEKEYPDVDYGEERKSSSYAWIFNLEISFKIEVEDNGVGGDRIEVAKGNIEKEIRRLIAGCELAPLPLTVIEKDEDEDPIGQPGSMITTYRLSDRQPGIEEIISWIDDNQPIAIVADADFWHIKCAEAKYGEENIDLAIEMSEKYSEYRIVDNKKLFEKYPKDSNGNLLHVVLGRDYIQEINNGIVHGEDNLSSCGACLNYIHDDPREEEYV